MDPTNRKTSPVHHNAFPGPRNVPYAWIPNGRAEQPHERGTFFPYGQQYRRSQVRPAQVSKKMFGPAKV